MTRSQKYDVSNSSTEYQVAASSSPDDTKEADCSLSTTNSSGKPVLTIADDPVKSKKHFIPWIALIIVGVCAVCFLGYMYGSPNSPALMNKPRPVFRRNFTTQGNLVLYPQVTGFNAGNRFPYEYFIGLDDQYMESNYDALWNLTNSYPHHRSDQPHPLPYVHCWLDTPSPNNPCFFDKGWLGRNCLKNNKFGYLKETNGTLNPCFAIRIENSGLWKPRNLREEEVNETSSKPYDPSFLGLDCHPEDNRASHIKIVQNPTKGYPLPFFPMDYFQTLDYLNPAVMLRIYGIKRRENVTIECWIRTPDSYHLIDGGKIKVTFFHSARISDIDPRAGQSVGSSQEDAITGDATVEWITNVTSESTSLNKNNTRNEQFVAGYTLTDVNNSSTVDDVPSTTEEEDIFIAN